MVLAFAFCNVSVMPLRREPAHSAEQVSQLLFGERAEILEVNAKDWARIRCEWDGYEAWGKISQLTTLPHKEYKKAAKFITPNHGSRLLTENADIWLPLGSELMKLRSGKVPLPFGYAKYKGKKLAVKSLAATCDNIATAAKLYMGAPYQWGGRSIAGIDCSGLTQMAYKLCNKALPRDASQQAQEGELVDFLPHSQCGDLAFFDNAEGKITHVGILLDNQTIIHATDASGCVTIDKIDQSGIISATLKRRTHNLRVVKRVTPSP